VGHLGDSACTRGMHEHQKMKEVPAQEVLMKEVPAQEVLMKEVPAQEVLMKEVPAQEVLLTVVPARKMLMNEVPAQEVLRSEVPAYEMLVAEEAKAGPPLEGARAGTGLMSKFPEGYGAQYPKVFSGDPSQYIRVVPQTITMVPGVVRTVQRRQMSQFKKEKILALLQTFGTNGWLVEAGREEGVSYAAQVHAVSKPDGSVRLTWDYRMTNLRVENEFYPMPFPLLELQQKLLGCRVFGKADLKKAYWQILLHVSSRKHVAVRVDDRICYPTRLPQGLKVSPQVCQRVLMAVLRGANDEQDLTALMVGRLLLYIDDLLLGARIMFYYLCIVLPPTS
jgi:hypothetical protein